MRVHVMTDHGIDEAFDALRARLAHALTFVHRMLRFWRVALSIVVVGAAACGLFLRLRTATYRSETVILYSEGVRMADGTERSEAARGVNVRLKEILMSRVALEAVGREFNLYPDVRRAFGPIGAAEELGRHVEFRAPGGETFSIAFAGASPEEAERVTRRLGELVIGQNSDLRRDQALVTRDFLEAEERTTEAGLRAREEELASFMAAHPRFAFDATPSSTGAAIRASRGRAATGLQPNSTVRRSGDTSPTRSAPGTSEPMTPRDTRETTADVARATAAVAAARANLSDLTTHFTAEHPDVRAAQIQLERETSRLAVATAAGHTSLRGASDAENAANVARPEESASPRMARPSVAFVPTSAALVAARAVPTEDLVALETDWVRLTRGVTEAREHQDHLEAALFKANVSASSEAGGYGAQMTVLDPAFLPRNAVPPGKTLIALLFLATSLALAILAAAIRVALDDRVYEARDVSTLSMILAEIPRASSLRAHAAR